MEWQPIETAPKNTLVLIWDGRIMCVAERWTYNGGKAWNWSAVGASGYECEDDFESPTHWMPLPEPPRSSGKTETE